MRPLFELPSLYSLDGRRASGQDVLGGNDCHNGAGDDNGCGWGGPGSDNGCASGAEYGNGCASGGAQDDSGGELPG